MDSDMNTKKFEVSTQSPEEQGPFMMDTISKLQEELEITRRENKQCWQYVQRLETILARMRSSAQCSKDERDRLKKKVRDLQTRLASTPNTGCQDVPKSDGNDSSDLIKCKISPMCYNAEDWRPPTPAIVPKLAERVRLKRLSTDDVLGAEISSLGMCNIHLAEHLTSPVQEASQLQELYGTVVLSAKNQEFQIELENLKHMANRLKSQVSFLELTLNESRTLSDNLSSLCAQLESNNSALQLVLRLDEYIEQSLDCLLRLGDSQLAFVLASCQAVHRSGSDQDNELLSLVRLERKRAEEEAKDFLHRLRNRSVTLIGADGIFGSSSDLNCEAHNDQPWDRSDEFKLLSLVEKLRMHRDAVRNSVVQLPSICSGMETYSNIDRDIGKPVGSLQEEKLCLENAVLLQELLAMKEDKSQLKARLLILERQNEIMGLTIRGKELELDSVRQRDDKKNNSQLGIDHAETIPNSTNLSEALFANQERQNEIMGLTIRGNELELDSVRQRDDKRDNSQWDIDHVETIPDAAIPDSTNPSESLFINQQLRQQKCDNLIDYLSRVNASLIGKLGRSKRKYKAKLRRLQQALRYVSEQYELEISALRGQVSGDARDSGNETVCSNVSETLPL